MAALDYAALATEIQARINAVDHGEIVIPNLTPAGLRHVDSCDTLQDALKRAANVPALFTLIHKAKGGGFEGRQVIGNPKQTVEVSISLISVTERWTTKSDGTLGAYDMSKWVRQTFRKWRSVQGMTDLFYDGDDFLVRVGPRLGWTTDYVMKATDDFL